MNRRPRKAIGHTSGKSRCNNQYDGDPFYHEGAGGLFRGCKSSNRFCLMGLADPARNSPQCLHVIASSRISSAQNGHLFIPFETARWLKGSTMGKDLAGTKTRVPSHAPAVAWASVDFPDRGRTTPRPVPHWSSFLPCRWIAAPSCGRRSRCRWHPSL